MDIYDLEQQPHGSTGGAPDLDSSDAAPIICHPPAQLVHKCSGLL